MAGRKEAQQKEEKSRIPKRDSSKSRQQRSPARKEKSPAKPRSPARTRSPARKSPSRAATTKSAAAVSPSRRSPGRRSPARNAKSVEVLKTTHSTVTATKKEYLTSLDSDSDTPDIIPERIEKPKIAVRGRSRNADVDRDSLKGLNDFVRDAKLESDPIKSYSNVLRRSTRSSQSAEVERVVRLTKYDVQAQKLTEFSDEDEIALKSSEGDREAERKKLVEFGGTIGACFLMLFLPLFVYGLHVFCNETVCSFTQLPDLEQYTSWATYFDLKTSLVYFGYLLVVGLLTVLPFGGRKISGLPNKHEKLEYTANATFCLITILLGAGALEVYGVGVVKFINWHYFHFILPAFVFGLLLAVFCYYRSYYVPVSALTTNSSLYQKKLYNFFMGRENNPKLFGVLHLKIFSLRYAIIGAIILNTACFFQSLKFTANKEPLTEVYGVNITLPSLDPTITTLYTLISVYFLDALIFEKELLSSFEIQYEGFGYMLAVSYSLYPFILSALVRYVYYHRIHLGTFKLIASTLVFLLGYVLYRGSNSQKDAFRRNPYHPSVAHLETISTNQGKKLIVSGFWGVVRKPNYLGDILMHLSLVPFVYNVPPLLCLLLTVFVLIHRTVRDNAHCKQKYGGSWERYCLKVKYVLIPKVY